MKMLVLIVVALGSVTLTAAPHPHHPKVPKDARICRECDGRGVVRTWMKAWVGTRACRDCDGRGYFMPPPPPPRMHNPPVKAHASGHHKGHGGGVHHAPSKAPAKNQGKGPKRSR